MKKLVSIFLALTLWAGLLAVPAAADETNLMVNGSFEEYAEGRFTGWTVQTPTDSGNTSYQNHEAVRGTHTNWGYCLSLSKNKDFAYYYIENVTGGKTYELSFDYQSLTDGRLEMMLSSRYAGGEAVDYSYIFFPATGGEWERSSFKYVVPEESNRVQVSFRVGSAAGEDGEAVKVDEIKFCAADSDENLGFENGLDGWMVSDGAEVSADAKTGAKSLKLSAGETASKIVLTDGNSVDICGYVKAAAGATASVKVTPIRRADDYTSSEAISVSDAIWKKAEFKTLLTGDGPAATLKAFFPVLLELSVTGEGEAYFDNFKVDSYTNLISNGSFEKNKTGWKKQRSGSNTTNVKKIDHNIKTATQESPAAHGNKYLAFTGEVDTATNDTRSYVEREEKIAVEAGKYYELSFYVTDEITRSQVQVPFYDSDGTEISNVNPYITGTTGKTNGWVKYNMVFCVPKAGSYGEGVTIAKDISYINIYLRMSSPFNDVSRYVYYDMVALRELDSYAGFYDNSLFMRSDLYSFSNLGKKVEKLSAGTFSFRFEKTAYTANTAFIVVGLYAKDAGGKKRLVEIKSIGEIEKVPYHIGTNKETDPGTDMGFKVPVTVTEEDIADTSLQYSLEAFVWETGGNMKPVSAVAVLEK